MFANHLLEVLDHLESDVVLSVAKIHEGPGISAVLGNDDFDRTIRINTGRRGWLAASNHEQCSTKCYEPSHNIILNKATNLTSVLAWLPSPVRPEMFRFAQHSGDVFCRIPLLAQEFA